MTSGADIYTYPPDPLFDIGDARDTFGTFRAGITELADGISSVLSLVESSWDGVAGEEAAEKIRAFRRCMDAAALALGTTKNAVDSYWHALDSARTKVSALRAKFDIHWPHGQEKPCVLNNTCTNHLFLTSSWGDSYEVIFTDVATAASTCEQLVRANMPDYTGLIQPPPPLGTVPTGGFLGWGIRGELSEYADQIMGLSVTDMNTWLSQASEDDLATITDSLDPDARQRFVSFLLSHANPLLLSKIYHGLPFTLPASGDRIGWAIPLLPDGQSLPLYPADPNGHDWISDINQRQYGDCWMLSTLAGVVATNPAWVQEHIKTNANGTVTVWLYDEKGKPIPVTVSPELPTENGTKATGVWSGDWNTLMSQGVAWPAYVEKAMASYYHSGNGPDGTYAGIEGDWATNAATYLTGHQATLTDSPTDITTALNAGKTVVVSSQGDAHNKDVGVIHENHAYTVTKAEDGLFYLRNPWGYEDPKPLTGDQLNEYFRDFTIVDSGH